MASVVEARNGRQQVAELVQAALDVVADAVGDVQAGVTAEQVPTVVDGVALGDLDVLVALAGALEREGHALVFAAAAGVERVDDLLARLVFDQLPGTRADDRVGGAVVELGADALLRARRRQLHARVVVDQRVPVTEAGEAAHQVRHGRHRPVGLDRVRNRTF